MYVQGDTSPRVLGSFAITLGTSPLPAWAIRVGSCSTSTNPRKGRDHILPSGNLALSLSNTRTLQINNVGRFLLHFLTFKVFLWIRGGHPQASVTDNGVQKRGLPPLSLYLYNGDSAGAAAEHPLCFIWGTVK